MPEEKRFYSEVDLEELMKRFSEKLSTENKKAFNAAIHSGAVKQQQESKYYYRLTEKRLYAYPELKDNIVSHELDIKDLEKEETTTRSKDIVRMPEGTGTRLTPEEKQMGKILVIRKKIDRDQKEIEEIDRALAAIHDDDYYMIIEYKYFGEMSDAWISEKMNCDDSTVRRHKSRLVSRIAVKLYGADANR